MRHRFAVLLLPLLLVVAGVGCISTSNSPTAPNTPNTGILTGTWSGDLSLLGTSARMTWTLTQTSGNATGPVLVLLPTGTVLMNGTFAGTLSGTNLTYTITIASGGIPSQPTCTGQLTGSGTVNTAGNSATIPGSYTVASSSCPIPFTSGTFTMTKS